MTGLGWLTPQMATLLVVLLGAIITSLSFVLKSFGRFISRFIAQKTHDSPFLMTPGGWLLHIRPKTRTAIKIAAGFKPKAQGLQTHNGSVYINIRTGAVVLYKKEQIVPGLRNLDDNGLPRPEATVTIEP